MVLKRIFSPLGRRYFTPHLKDARKRCNSLHCHTFITLLGVWRGWSIAPCDLVDALVARQHSQNSMAAIHYLTAMIKFRVCLHLSEDVQRCCDPCTNLHTDCCCLSLVFILLVQNCSNKRSCCDGCWLWCRSQLILHQFYHLGMLKCAFTLSSFVKVKKDKLFLRFWSRKGYMFLEWQKW